MTKEEAAALYVNSLPNSWDNKYLDACQDAFEAGVEFQLNKDRLVVKEIDEALANLYNKWNPSLSLIDPKTNRCQHGTLHGFYCDVCQIKIDAISVHKNS